MFTIIIAITDKIWAKYGLAESMPRMALLGALAAYSGPCIVFHMNFTCVTRAKEFILRYISAIFEIGGEGHRY